MIMLVISAISQSQISGKAEVARLIKTIQKYHIDPPVINDEFSENVFNLLLIHLDPYSIFFTKEDIAQFEKYRKTLDDEYINNAWEFIPCLTSIYKRGIIRADSLINEITKTPFDFSGNEKFQITDDIHPQFYASGKEMKERITGWLKYEELQIMLQPASDDDTINLIAVTDQKEAHKKNAEYQERLLNRLKAATGNMENYLAEEYLKTIALCADPHSEYMSAKEMKLFTSALSDDNMLFGFSIEENKSGQIQISRLLPGSPAWKSGEINEGDIILKMQWKGEQEIDISNYSLYEINMFLVEPDKQNIKLTVQKLNGNICSVELKKAKLKQDENIVKSFLLNGKHTIGYILLPGFYTSFENDNELGCANDVAKEIIKLRKDKIEGLIIDLRNNGGGSMKEAIDLAGIFIDFGPVAIVKDKNRIPQVVKDLNRGSIYDGPLVILVNEFSASASELFAAAMQDYKRAIIIGHPTFGKATSQIIIPCDTTINPYIPTSKKTGEPGSFVKITINRLYRITGLSIQQQGITPDIQLPGIPGNYQEKELTLPHSLKADTIVKKTYFTTYPALSLDSLNERSKNRMKNLTNVQMPSCGIAEENTITLNYNRYRQYLIDFRNYQNALSSFQKISTDLLSVKSNTFDSQLFNMDPENKRFFDQQCKKIAEDAYIHETYNVISDYIELQKNKTID